MSIQSVSFQGYNSNKRKENMLFAAGAPVMVAGWIAANPLIDKTLRQDTIVKTLKAGAKNFSKDAKDVATGFCKYVLRNEDLAKKVSDIKTNNKKLFAAAFVVDSIVAFGLFKLGSWIGSKVWHKN